MVDALDNWCCNIGKSPLKPTQRVILLNQYALPRLFYSADMGDVSDVVLRALDGKVKGAVKAWLHLPSSTCDGLLYVRNRDGGLGICKITRHILSMEMRRLFRLAHSLDPVVHTLMQSSHAQSERAVREGLAKGRWYGG